MGYTRPAPPPLMLECPPRQAARASWDVASPHGGRAIAPSLPRNLVPGRVVQGWKASSCKGPGDHSLAWEGRFCSPEACHRMPGKSAASSGVPQVVATCAIIPQEPHWVSTEAPAFFSEFYLLISPWVTQPCQGLFPSYYLASIFLMAPFLMILKQRGDGER